MNEDAPLHPQNKSIFQTKSLQTMLAACTKNKCDWLYLRKKNQNFVLRDTLFKS